MLRAFGFNLCRLLAVPIAGVELNDIIEVEQDGAVVKRRRWYSPGLTAFCNFALRIMGTGMEVLDRTEWLEWEAAMHPRVLRGSGGTAGEVSFSRIEGRTLADLAGSSAEHLESAVSAAVLGLYQLHHRQISWRGLTLYASHGDATARNVIISPDGAAEWFDFDARHRLDLPAERRRADDLMTFILSLASVHPGPFGDLLALIIETYSDREIIEIAGRRLRRPFSLALPVKLAQGNISFQRWLDISGELDRKMADLQPHRAAGCSG